MKSLSLIERLAAANVPVRPLGVSRWFPGAVFALVAVPFFLPGGARWNAPEIWLSFALGAGFLARALVLSALPGRTDAMTWLRLAFVVLAAAAVALWHTGSHAAAVFSLPCLREGLVTSALTSFALSFFLKRLAVVRGAITGGLLGPLGAVAGLVVLHWTCASGDAGHIMVSHWLLPLLLSSVVGTLLGRWVFRW